MIILDLEVSSFHRRAVVKQWQVKNMTWIWGGHCVVDHLERSFFKVKTIFQKIGILFDLRINALCCYPNVNGSVRNSSMNTSTAPIFLQFNCFRENIWVIFKVQFHFLYIFVGRVDRIRKTSHITMLSFYLFPSNLQSFGDELNRSSKTAPQIFELIKIESKYLDISKCVFTMNCSTEKKIVF